MMKSFSLTFIALIASTMTVLAAPWTVETVPNTKLQNAATYISDPDNLIDDASKAQINSALAATEDSTTAEVFVVALKSTGDVDIKQFATELFNYWHIGKKSKDNGLLILMVEDQYKVTFETGYGVEGVLPDAICMRIINDKILPYMKGGNYGEGLLSGVKAVSEILTNPAAAKEIHEDMAAEESAARKDALQKVWTLLTVYLAISLLVLILVIGSNGKKRKSISGESPYDQYRKMDSSKTGYKVLTIIFPVTMIFFYIFYVLQMKKLRKMPRMCPECGKPMKLMSEKQEDAYLDKGEQAEEMVGSIDYDAWVCMECGHRYILPYGKTFTRYSTCPNCGYKTFIQTTDHVVVPPTPLTAGRGERVYRCANCHHEVIRPYIIPMIIIASSRGGRGGFGGGDFGGFGGGSFGGGMSGGGGATGSWK